MNAEKALELDPLDPFSNFNMGRSYWLEGDIDRALTWLDRAVQVSPNYAQGIYTMGLMNCLAGNADASIPQGNRLNK